MNRYKKNCRNNRRFGGRLSSKVDNDEMVQKTNEIRRVEVYRERMVDGWMDGRATKK